MADPGIEGNIGELLHSPSAALMKLVDCDHLNDFDVVCEYLSEHTSEVSSWHVLLRSTLVRIVIPDVSAYVQDGFGLVRATGT